MKANKKISKKYNSNDFPEKKDILFLLFQSRKK